MQLCCSSVYSVPDQGVRHRRHSKRELNCYIAGSSSDVEKRYAQNASIFFEAREEKNKEKGESDKSGSESSEEINNAPIIATKKARRIQNESDLDD